MTSEALKDASPAARALLDRMESIRKERTYRLLSKDDAFMEAMACITTEYFGEDLPDVYLNNATKAMAWIIALTLAAVED